MAAIVDPHDQIDLVELNKALQKSLPSYSRPLFIRLMRQAADTTGKVKAQKFTLKISGFNFHLSKEKFVFHEFYASERYFKNKRY